MSPDWISLPEDRMVATIGNDHFSMVESTVDEDPDRVYYSLDNNVYRKLSVHLCEWAEIFIEGSSDIGAFVLQNIRTIKALLSMIDPPDSRDDPGFSHVFLKGTHIREVLQVLQKNPVTRSRIIQRHTRNTYRTKNNALRIALRDFQSDIDYAISAGDDANQSLTVLLQRTSLAKLDLELDAIFHYLEWALDFIKWRQMVKGDGDPKSGDVFSVMRYHLNHVKSSGSLENII